MYPRPTVERSSPVPVRAAASAATINGNSSPAGVSAPHSCTSLSCACAGGDSSGHYQCQSVRRLMYPRPTVAHASPVPVRAATTAVISVASVRRSVHPRPTDARAVGAKIKSERDRVFAVGVTVSSQALGCCENAGRVGSPLGDEREQRLIVHPPLIARVPLARVVPRLLDPTRAFSLCLRVLLRRAVWRSSSRLLSNSVGPPFVWTLFAATCGGPGV